MSINSSVQQLGGGLASVLGGWLISQNASGQILHYDQLGYVTIGAFLICIVMMYYVNRYVSQKTAKSKPAGQAVRQEEAAMAE